MIDYQPPGAYEYIKFLKKEFIPYIERQYRVTDSRSFYGASIGGVVGGILIGDERESPCFKNYILADGAMSLVSKSDIFNGNNIPIGSRPVNVFLTGTLQGNGVSVKNYAAELKENSLGNTRILYKQYELSHEEMGLPTLIEFIDELD
jgi:predicted alpha/beta superfamily hydrolase